MIMTLDPAISLNGDATAMVMTGTGTDNKTYILDYANMRTDSVQKICDTLFEKMIRWQCKMLRIEAIGFQRLLKHWIFEEMRKRKYYFGVDEVKHHKASKEARIMALQPRLASGSLLFGKGQQEIKEQFLIFPRGAHDDRRHP